MAESKRVTGIVRWFSGQKGFGFIAPDGEGEAEVEDVFVHQTSIRSDGFRTLSEGEAVEFVIDLAEDGRSKAVDVISLSGSRFSGGGRGRGRRGRGGGGRGRGGGGYGGYDGGYDGYDDGYGRGGRGGRIDGSGGGGACYNCGRTGHLARDCYHNSGGGSGGEGYGGGSDGGRGGYGGGGRGGYGAGRGGYGGGRGGYGGGRGRGEYTGGGGGRGGGGNCYNCGEEGHFARECPNDQN